MKIHHLRNATMVIETKDQFILVDPMLGKKELLDHLLHFLDLNQREIQFLIYQIMQWIL